MRAATTTAGAIATLALLLAARIVSAAAPEPIYVELPDKAFAHEGASIAIDIDGYDVTGFASFEDQALVVALDSPLAAGQHDVLVLLFLEDGSSQVLVEGTFDVAPATGTQWSASSALQTDYRLDEEPESGVDERASNGSLAFEFLRTGRQLELGASVETIFDPNNQDISGDNFLLPGYNVSVVSSNDSASTYVGAGTVAIARNDLLFSGYQRRGLEVAAADAEGRFSVQAFTVNANARNAFDGDYLLPGDPGERAGGLTSNVAIVRDHLEIGLGFVDGKTSLGGAGFNSQVDPTIYGGSSWNVSIDSSWRDGGVWLRAEQAESEFDFDGIGIGLPESSDDAQLLTLQLSSDGNMGTGPFAFWSATFQHQRVGRDFYSLGNLSIPGDLEISSAYLQSGFRSVTLDLELAREQTNADNDPLLPTQTLDRAGISFSYTPAALDPENRFWQTIGAPSLSGWLYRTSNEQPDADALLAGFDVDSVTDEFGLALQFAKETVTWGVEHGVVDFEDASVAVIDNGFLLYEPPSDSRNRQTMAQASWYPGDRLTLEGYLQRNNYEESDFGDEYRNQNFGINGTFLIVPDRLSLSVNVNQAEDRNTFGNPQFIGEDYRSRFASLQFNYHLREAAGNRPGLSFHLNGGHGRNEDLALDVEEDSWSVFLGAIVSWAGSPQ